MHVEIWPIDRPVPYARNARKIPQSAIDKVAASIKEFGWRQPIVVDADGVIVAGHTRLLGARKLGLTEVPVHVAHGLTPAQIKAYRLMDNRSHQEAAWDVDLIGPELLDIKGLDLDLSLTGFDPTEIDGFLAKLDASEGLTDPDACPEVQPDPITVPGDLWLLGRHRLLCGDSTSIDAVERLMGGEKAEVVITDPPYNVGFDYGEKVDDEKDPAAYADWNRAWFHIARSLASSCVVLTPGITNLPMWIADIEKTHKILAWVKENQCSRNYIGKTSGFNVWEPILVYGQAKKCVSRDSFSIPIHIQSDTGNHPCPKSIKAWSWLVEAFTDERDVLFEPFSGSGTTLIASEKLGRTSRGLELEPKYCDVIVRRWQEFTGKQATLDGDGRTFDEIANARTQAHTA
jgi:DNA modification methylase